MISILNFLILEDGAPLNVISQPGNETTESLRRKLALQAKKHSEELRNAGQNMGAAKHLGIAAQKGIKAGGEAAGSFVKKVGEFASEHPVVAAGTVGALGAGLILNKKKQPS